MWFGYLLESPQWGDSNKYSKDMFYEKVRTKKRPFLLINLLIKYSVQQLIHFCSWEQMMSLYKATIQNTNVYNFANY